MCPNLGNPAIRLEFEELVNVIGERAAYAVWNLSEGNGLERDLNGNPSLLFQELMSDRYYNGDREKVIKAVAYAYSNTFRSAYGDWIEHKALPDAATVFDWYADDFEYDESVDDSSIDHIKHITSVNSKLQAEFNLEISGKTLTPELRDEEEKKFYNRKLLQAANGIIVKMAKHLGLEPIFGKDSKVNPSGYRDKIGGKIFKRTVGRGALTMLATIGIAHIVGFNPVIAIPVAGAVALGSIPFIWNVGSRMRMLSTMYQRLLDPKYRPMMIRMLIDLNNGSEHDPRMDMRFICETYYDMFENDDLVMAAKKVLFDKYKDISHREMRERIIKEMMSLIEGKSVFSHVASAIKKAVTLRFMRKSASKTTLFRSACKFISLAVCANEYLSNIPNDAKFKTLRHYSNNPESDSKANNLSIIAQLIKLNKLRLDALMSLTKERDPETLKTIEQLRSHISQLKTVNIERQDEVTKAVYEFINYSYVEVSNLIKWLDDNQHNYADPNFDINKVTEYRTNVLGGIKFYMDSYLRQYVMSMADDPDYAPDSQIAFELDELKSAIAEAEYKLKNIQDLWGDIYVSKLAEIGSDGIFDNTSVESEGTVISGTELLKRKAVLSLHNKLLRTPMLEWFGSKLRLFGWLGEKLSQINYHQNHVVRLVHNLVRSTDLDIYRESVRRANILKNKYKAYSTLGSRASFFNQFNNFLEFDGKHHTANFLSAVNVGKYENELHDFRKAFYEEHITRLVKELQFLQDNVDRIYTTDEDILNSLGHVLGKWEIFDGVDFDRFVEYISNGNFNTVFDYDEYTLNTEDEYIKRAFQNEEDRFNRGRKHKRYKAEYYIARRRYLSPDTMEAYDLISDAISTIRSNCYDKDLKFYDETSLTPEDKNKLADYEEQLRNLQSDYVIVKDNDGNIIHFAKKTGDDLRMAMELLAWNKEKALHVQRDRRNLFDKADALLAAVEAKYGKDSEQYKFLENDLYVDVPDFDTIGERLGWGPLPEELEELYELRKYLIGLAKDNPYDEKETPKLERLSEDVVAEIQRVDNAISTFRLHSEPDKEDDEERETLTDYSTLVEIVNPSTGVSYLSEFQHKYRYNMSDFYSKYFTRSHNPLSMFYERVYFTGYMTQEVSAKYLDYVMDDSADNWVDSKYEEEDDFLGIDKDKYKNLKYYEVFGIDKDGNVKNKAAKEFYDELISMMDAAWEMLPKNRRHYRFQMPQFENDGFTIFSTNRARGNRLSALWTSLKYREKENMSADFFGQRTIKPDGTEVNTIPMRGIKPLKKNAWNVDTDIVKTVSEFYEMALNYKHKSELEGHLLALENILSQGRDGMSTKESVVASNRLHQYMQQYIYGRGTVGMKFNGSDKMSGWEKFMWKVTKFVQRNTRRSYLNHSATFITKNGADSLCAFLLNIFRGEYGVGSSVKGLFLMIYDGITKMNSDLNWTRAAIIYTNLHEGVSETFAGYNKYYIHKFIGKFLTNVAAPVDYTIKGWLVNTIFNMNRLVEDPITGEKRFMTKREAKLRYASFFGSRFKAAQYWGKSKVSMRDAYVVDKNGNLTVKPEYADVITKKLESKVTSYLQDTASIVNGMFTKYYKNEGTANPLAAFFLTMRGWALTQWNDHKKDGMDMMGLKPNLTGTAFVPSDAETMDEHNLLGVFDYDSGELRRGDWVGGLTTNTLSFVLNIGKCFFGNTKPIHLLARHIAQTVKRTLTAIMHFSRLELSDALTEHQKYKIRTFIGINLIMIANVILSFPVARWIEKDRNFPAYLTGATMTGLQGELLSKNSVWGFMFATKGFIEAPFVTDGYIKDYVDILPVAKYACDWVLDLVDGGRRSDDDAAELSQRVEWGSHKGLTKIWSSLLNANGTIPGLNVINFNNIYKSFTVSGLQQKMRFASYTSNIPEFMAKAIGGQPFALELPHDEVYKGQTGLFSRFYNPKESIYAREAANEGKNYGNGYGRRRGSRYNRGGYGRGH